MSSALPLALGDETVALLAVGVLFVLGALSWVVRIAMIQGTGQRPAVEAGERTNCPSCGARVVATADRCEYCDEALEPAARE